MSLKTIHVALACDDNFAFYCAETIVSLLVNTYGEDININNEDIKNKDIIYNRSIINNRKKNNNIHYHFYIIQDNLSKLNRERIAKLKYTIKDCDIEFIDIDTSENRALKLATCYRLKLASLLPHLDKIIYTDCDVTFLDSLEEIWDEDMDGYYCGCCINPKTCLENNLKYYKKTFDGLEHNFNFEKYSIYYNAGFMVLNLKKIREDDVENIFMNFLGRYPDLDDIDQNCLNLLCYDKIKPISFRWSFLISYYTSMKYKVKNKDLLPDLRNSAKHPKMIHFLSDKKPTRIYISILRPFAYGIVNRYKRLFWKYVALTDWKDEKIYETIYRFPLGFLNWGWWRRHFSKNN